MIDPKQTEWFVFALTGSTDTIIDWRCIHDQRKDLPAHNFRGTYQQSRATLEDYSARGYGVFCTINQLDGKGRELSNVQNIRAHVVDLDNTITAEANFARVTQDGANFVVQSSPGKYHAYFKVEPYTGNEAYTLIQRKLAQFYDGDRKVIDATRVMRVPGFPHQKGEPTPVNTWPLPNYDKIHTHSNISATLAAVNVVDIVSSRQPLGTEDMQAPSLEWLQFALKQLNPNDMDRTEWLSFTAAFKQAGWNLTDEQTLYDMWLTWCNTYGGNDEGENRKMWNSIKDSEVGWSSIERRGTIKAYISFGMDEPPQLTATPKPTPTSPTATAAAITSGQPTTVPQQEYGEILSPDDCKTYFKDCFFVERTGQIFNPSGRFMNSTQFNGRYGGKQFIITSQGKLTDEPWKAALRSTCWTIPKVDHVRFLPDHKTFAVIEDDLKRSGLNTYVPAHVKATPGDLTLWFDWFDRIFPDKNDQKIIFDYMAHCVKYPGHKMSWSILIQSAEGIGKTIFKEVLANALGSMYVYSPKAPELVKSGSTFNAWMRGKLMILVDEIKIDERRELIEILKPMITDDRIEIQSKGVDQDMEDNPSNWIFFSNFKDAIPINQNGRRYSIFYSTLQSKADILAAGMDDAFFNRMWKWLRHEGGIEAITYWLLNYDIEKGAIPVRAPDTSSQAEAIRITRSPLEAVVADAVKDDLPGFRGGYVSVLAVIRQAKARGIRQPAPRVVQNCLEGMGLVHLGRHHRPYEQEDVTSRSEIYADMSSRDIKQYGRAQGYE